MPHPRAGSSLVRSASDPLSSTFLLTLLERQLMMTQACGPLLPMWETRMGFLAPGFNLGHTWLLGSEPTYGRLSLSLSLFSV